MAKQKRQKPKKVLVELTPELRAAITQVYNDGEQNWDLGEGWPPSDRKIARQYMAVLPLTNWADKGAAS